MPYPATATEGGQKALDELIDLLDVERLDTNLLRGRPTSSGSQRVYGGQVAGQALVAAGRTVDVDRPVHSLHSYFVRPGDSSRPIIYHVERIRDGRSFSTRRVVAVQDGETIFTLSASFQLRQDGLDHQMSMPDDVPEPESLPPALRLFGGQDQESQPAAEEPLALDLRWIETSPPSGEDASATHRSGLLRQVWLRANGELPDDPLLHVCVVTYASDLTLLGSVLLRHGMSRLTHVISLASLDHAMWFTRPFRADQWLLYTTKSPSAAGGRGLATGRFHTRDGRHVVSTAQEGLVRVARRQPDRSTGTGLQ